MATLLSIPAAVTVLKPGSSVLSTIVAAMAPGSWAQFNVANQSSILGVGSSTGSIIPYCNAMPWNPVNRCIEIIGGDHGSPTGLRHVRYVEATNTFETVSIDTGLRGHGYDHTEVNPFTGDVYHKHYGTIGMQPLVVSRKPIGSSSFSALPTVNVSQIIIHGTCWWSGPFTGGSGLGAQGGFAVYSRGGANGATDGTISIFDPISNSWRFNATGMSPNLGTSSSGYIYNEVMAYSGVKNVAVYGGGHGNERRMWRLSSNGSALELTNAPADIMVGIHSGVLIEDPVTGNFLVLSQGHLYELNPDGAGTWTRQTGSRIPPSGVGIPSGSGPEMLVIGVPLPDHGVVAFVRQTNSGRGSFWLYKHA
jgi:hypothetical protein